MTGTRKPIAKALKRSSRSVKLTEPKNARGLPGPDPRQALLFPEDSPVDDQGRRCGAEWGLIFEGDPQQETDLVKNYRWEFEKGGDFLARMEWHGYVRKEEALRQGKRLREIVRTPTHLYLIEEKRMIEAWVFFEGTWKLCAQKQDDGSYSDYGTHPETP